MSAEFCCHQRRVSGFLRVLSGSLTGPPTRHDSNTDAIISTVILPSSILHSGRRSCSIAVIRSRQATSLPVWLSPVSGSDLPAPADEMGIHFVLLRPADQEGSGNRYASGR